MRSPAFAFAARTACFTVFGVATTLAAIAFARTGRADPTPEPGKGGPETNTNTNANSGAGTGTGTEAEAELTALRRALAAHAEEASRLDHAFRTPIGAAAAALQLLETSRDDPELQAQARQVIARQLSRMTALTDSLREAAQRLGGRE
ncbi:His Kinase A (phospho-acceptor) domain protein [Variovorax sp. PBL-H6]|uniref:histidine kinase dimerization/phospho-acceptor domain-containing protein n=1 Tax=Variovorax sp. PBL-H6 TaxID=434009 RepID=UPI00131661BC|nr:histidine kinase dimerization/phospho-acceptor domain-containing protein [Variovorax sp. PBL-H6]VTU39440.1 His Kinase A (phospho-acceptor) domain protein [Variovorax sp. PBL-H6]